MSDDAYVCTRCARAYPNPGHCPTHPEEPLLDGNDKEVWRYLSKLDDEAAHKFYMIWIGLGVLAGVLVAVFLLFVVLAGVSRTRSADVRVSAMIFIAPVAAGGTAGLWLARRLFRPRYAQFTRRLEEHVISCANKRK